MHRFVYLASASARRARLLDRIGVPHRPLVADRSENVAQLEEERSGESPEDHVRRVALLELDAARRRRQQRGLPEAPIVCAHSAVALGRRLLGPPSGPDDAAAMLRALAGRTHRTLTAVAVSAGRESLLALGAARVRLAALPEHLIRACAESGEPLGIPGACAADGRIAQWIERVDGSPGALLGLPLYETRELLARARVAYGW